LILLISAAIWCNFFVVVDLRATNFGRVQVEKAAAKNTSVLSGVAKDIFRVWNLSYKQVIHSVKRFTTV